MSTEIALCAYYLEKLSEMQRYASCKEYLLAFWKLEKNLLESCSEFYWQRPTDPVMFSIPIEDEWQNQVVDIYLELEMPLKTWDQFIFNFTCCTGSMALYQRLEERHDCEAYHNGDKTSLGRVYCGICLGKKGYFFNCVLQRVFAPKQFFHEPVLVHSVIAVVAQ